MYEENQRLFAKADIHNVLNPGDEPLKVASAGNELLFVRELPDFDQIMVRHPKNHIPIFVHPDEVTTETPEGFVEPTPAPVEPETIFEVGRTVYLKSGGPELEILEVNGDEVKTTWINEKGEPDTLTGDKAIFCGSLKETHAPSASGASVPADQ